MELCKGQKYVSGRDWTGYCEQYEMDIKDGHTGLQIFQLVSIFPFGFTMHRRFPLIGRGQDTAKDIYERGESLCFQCSFFFFPS